jgi:hypothetical protein
MIEWMAAGFLVVGFVVLANWFRLVEKSGNVVALSRRSLDIIRDKNMADDAKEAALRANAARLFGLAFMLALGASAAVLAPTALVWLCDCFGWISPASVYEVALSPAFLTISGVLIVATFFVSHRRKRANDASRSEKVNEGEQYSTMDRLLHRVAFRTRAAQLAMADVEDRVFAKRLAACNVDRPVFITGLPRSGTTMLLECCAGMREFASHCYRDMPFVLVPCLWNRFSASFRQNTEPRERAHGDGMLIDFDSPEALEEVLWKAFWRRHYRSDRIVPWNAGDERETADEFREFFRGQMRKIIFVRRGGDAPSARYLSKNNLNIARTAVLRRLFPDALIVVPFREPLQHALSLLRQHRNFLEIHKKDRFASEYMRAIGHYEFGDNLRPVDFDGWFDRRESKESDSLAFWLEYWAAGYRHLLGRGADSIRFIDYDALCENPEQGLALVADAIGSRDPETLLAAAKTIHAAKPRAVDVAAVSPAILRETERVHAELKSQADAKTSGRNERRHRDALVNFR